jgi:hypothetical protein
LAKISIIKVSSIWRPQCVSFVDEEWEQVSRLEASTTAATTISYFDVLILAASSIHPFLGSYHTIQNKHNSQYL